LEQFLAALDGLVRLLQDRRRVDGEPVLTLEYVVDRGYRTLPAPIFAAITFILLAMVTTATLATFGYGEHTPKARTNRVVCECLTNY
ncbi:hypothetical protein PRIPAC_90740, partial [Pristionchus pacificus]|uniref:Uncharacterized protein n=1 Tax=Pristionchus pacificus TaxID=54126 RepID=A0A2A6CWC7_PRIPA